MKSELERGDIEVIVKEVVELMKPLLARIAKQEPDITVFDVKGLAEYLKVNESWVYNQVHLKTIPYFKCGKYTRFRKAAIDRWIEKESVRPLPTETRTL